MKILVTGFGPFLDVADNPTAVLAAALDGRTLGGAVLIGQVLPVSYRRGPAEAVRLARAHAASLVLGFGVSRRAQVEVERRAVFVSSGRPDVDGESETGLLGPREVFATLDPSRLAKALAAGLSDDAGQYVCNAWLYTVASSLDVPVGFVHVPPQGIEPERVCAAIEQILSPDPSSLS